MSDAPKFKWDVKIMPEILYCSDAAHMTVPPYRKALSENPKSEYFYPYIRKDKYDELKMICDKNMGNDETIELPLGLAREIINFLFFSGTYYSEMEVQAFVLAFLIDELLPEEYKQKNLKND